MFLKKSSMILWTLLKRYSTREVFMMTVFRKTVVHEMAPPKVTPGDTWAFLRRIGPKSRATLNEQDPVKYQQYVEQALNATLIDMLLGSLRLIPGRFHSWRERRQTRHVYIMHSA